MARKTLPTHPPAVLEFVWSYEDGSSLNLATRQSCPSKRLETRQEEHRQRRAHRKVRTGCLTCKIRRKKCDESKPECQRCRSTGRVCDGYSTNKSPKDATPRSIDGPSLSSLASNPVNHIHTTVISSTKWPEKYTTPASKHRAPFNYLCRPPNLFAALGSLTDLDRHCFSYFCHRTAPQFTSYFEALVWRSSSMRGIHHPALFSAAVALGAVHRRFCYGISREAFEYCAHAERLHKRAIRHLEVLKDQDFGGEHSDQDDHVLVVEIMLGVFQAFQGEADATIEHINTGLYHLIRGRPLRMIRSERRYCVAKSRPGLFCKLFHQLYCRLTELLDSPIVTLVKTTDGQPLPSIPHEFRDLEDARNHLFTEVDWVTHTPARWEDLITRSQALSFHVDRLKQWSLAYNRTVAKVTRTPRQNRACTFMKLARNSAYLLMLWTLFADAETYLPSPLPDLEDTPDEYNDYLLTAATRVMSEARTKIGSDNANLADVKRMVEVLLNHPSICDAADEDVEPKLRKGPYPCESSEVGVYTVANQITLVADNILFETLAAMVPEHMDSTLPDVTCMVEERMLLLRYYTPHPDGIGQWWTQEWWTF